MLDGRGDLTAITSITLYREWISLEVFAHNSEAH
jgi:hypothetical protein